MSLLIRRGQTPNESASEWPVSDAPGPMNLTTGGESPCTVAGAHRRPPLAPKTRDRAVGAGRNTFAAGEPALREGYAPCALHTRREGTTSAGMEVAPLAGSRTGRRRTQGLAYDSNLELIAEALHRSELRQNRLLAAMPRADRSRLELRTRSAYVEAGTALFEMGSALTEAIFPVTAVISLCHVTGGGHASTIGIVGDEGMAGLDCVTGAPRSAYRAVVNQPGRVIAVPMRAVANQMGVSAEMRKILLGYALACYVETARALVCVQRHSLEQRFCGWLLLLSERSRSRELWVSQEHLGEMLGVRRETVTEVAGRMRRRGFINYRRGRVLVLNQVALSALACDCRASSGHGQVAATDVCDDPPERLRSALVGAGQRPARGAVASA